MFLFATLLWVNRHELLCAVASLLNDYFALFQMPMKLCVNFCELEIPSNSTQPLWNLISLNPYRGFWNTHFCCSSCVTWHMLIRMNATICQVNYISEHHFRICNNLLFVIYLLFDKNNSEHRWKMHSVILRHQ